jgi:adenine-specific DNA methylase
MLSPPERSPQAEAAIIRRARLSTLRRNLTEALNGLLEYERACLQQAEGGCVEGLCDLIEHGSLTAMNDDSPPAFARLLRDTQRRLTAMRLDTGASTVVSRHFGGVYFTWQQAIDLDAILAEVHNLPHRERDYYLAAVLAAASDTVNTVGKQFAQPMRPRDAQGRPKWHLVRQILRDRALDVFVAYAAALDRFSTVPRYERAGHIALRADYRNLLNDRSVRFDAVYADPPYTRDHYSRYYHVLETISLHDDPHVSTTKIHHDGQERISRGRYRDDRHQSPFCIKSRAPGAFDELFGGVRARGIPLVLSYSPYMEHTGARPRLVTVNQLLEIARRHFARVDIAPVRGLAHNKFNQTERNVPIKHEAEVIVTCHP